MASELTPDERRAIAAATGVNADYLYQCLTGRKQMEAAQARDLEARTFGKVKRYQLRQKDWHRIWPELIGADGAPPVPESDASRVA